MSFTSPDISQEEKKDFLSYVEDIIKGKSSVFPIGAIYVTPKALAASSRAFKNKILEKHGRCDYGIVTAETSALNDRDALDMQGSVISAYVTPERKVLVVGTSFRSNKTTIVTLEEAKGDMYSSVDFSKVPK